MSGSIVLEPVSYQPRHRAYLRCNRNATRISPYIRKIMGLDNSYVNSWPTVVGYTDRRQGGKGDTRFRSLEGARRGCPMSGGRVTEGSQALCGPFWLRLRDVSLCGDAGVQKNEL